MNPDLNGALTALSMLTARAVASNTNSAVVDLQPYSGNVKVMLDAGAATAGTNASLAVKLYHSSEESANYVAVTGGEFTAVTTSASLQSLAVDTRGVNRYLMAVATISGTNSPSFPASLHAVGFKKYAT